MLLNSSKFERARCNEKISERKLLNIGCGSHFHSDWINLDLISDNLNVIPERYFGVRTQ